MKVAYKASRVTTHGEMEVQKLLPFIGPRGFISKPWMSRAKRKRQQRRPEPLFLATHHSSR